MSMGAQSMLGDYVQNSVEAEDPLDLVCLLYAKAIERTKAAREHMNRREIPERARAIALASQIILELQTSLNVERGGEIAVNLARVYDFLQEQLVEANAQQKVEPLDVSLRLLDTLYEGWQECRAQRPQIPAPKPAPLAVVKKAEPEEEVFEAVGAGGSRGRAWTL